MKNWKRLLVGALALSCAALSVGCGEDPQTPPDGDDPQTGTVHSQFNGIEGLEKDYVYMWYPNGLDDREQPYLNFQAEHYGLSFNTSTGMIEGMGVLENDGPYYVEMDDMALPYLPTMYYDIRTEAGHLRTDGTADPAEDTNRLWARAIESGRNMQRADVISLNYQNLEGTLISGNFLGRIEIAANREYFALNYGVYNDGPSLISDATLSFSIDLGIEYSEIEQVSERRITATNGEGEGFTFLIPDQSQDSAVMEAEGSVLTFTKEGFDLPSKQLEYNGFGVVVIPTTSEVTPDSVAGQENAQISAVQVQPQEGLTQDAVYDADRGIFVVNTDNMMPVYEPFTEDQLDSYEKLTFRIKNNGSDTMKVPVAFEKTVGSSFNAMGYVPMIRRTDGEQTGISVQISKNWHSYDNGDTAQYPPTHYKRYLEGKWSMCYAMIEVPAGEEIEYEYCVAYAKWGGVYSVSHAQLCLIGYASDWIWDQSCLGSWGESVCYDPDRCLGRSLIDDTRPFGMSTVAGSYMQYHWTDNIGGADFLWYYSLDENQQLKEGRIINQKVNYRSQGPNMSDVVYLGRTADGCLDAFINIRMGRTDDIIRCYYTITYQVVKDLTFSELALFKLGAEKYADTQFSQVAYGNDQEILREGGNVFVATEVQETEGNNPWFMIYDADSIRNPANKMFTVREFAAEINGQTYTQPSFRLTRTNNGQAQPSVELSVPAAAGKTLKAGSRIDMVIEMAVLPNPSADPASSYYGQSDYLRATMDLFNTPESALQQAKGNSISVTASVGTLRGRYPVEIDAAAGSVAAQFSMTGGLGYTPVVFNKLDAADGYKLQANIGGEWVDVVQAGTKGETKDFYSVRQLADGSYQWIFNVKNTDGLNFGTTTEYRLVKG